MQHARKTGAQHNAEKIFALAVLFNHLWHAQFGAFVGGKAFVTCAAFAPAANAIALVVEPGIDYLGIERTAEGAFHRSGARGEA